MTQQQEKLSALVDGEFEGESLVSSLSNDQDMSDKWKRYHLIRDCMRNEMSADINFDVSAQVAKQLENEMAIVAPKRTWKELPVVASVIPLLKQSGQLAVAACVTAVMIFSYQSYNTSEENQPFLTAPTSGTLGGLAPVSLSSTNGVSEESMARLLEQRRQINAVIEDHERQIRLKNASLMQTSEQVQKVENDEIADEASTPKK